MRIPFILFIGALTLGHVAAATEGSEPLERMQFTEADLPKDENDPNGISEIDEFARRRGFNYARLTRRAARGDAKALKRFFEMGQEVDGAAAESHSGVPTAVYHLLGDEKFAHFLTGQPLTFRVMVRNSVARGGDDYFRRYFPETTKVLFQRELVAWPSPDKRYAIRKIFSNEFTSPGSKVRRAELIDQKSGQAVCDLTADDIGTGGEREGAVLWSPDSKRFAYLSSDLTPLSGNLFSTPRPVPLRKQTVVYQLSAESFTRVDLAPSEPPDRENDAELKRAIPGHEYTTPIRWQKPNVLILERHEYFEVLKPTVVGHSSFESIHTLARWYRITATIGPEGTASLVWKRRDD